MITKQESSGHRSHYTLFCVLNKAPHHEEVLGGGGITPCINLNIRFWWVVSFMPQPLYPWGKDPPPPYPLDRRLGGPQSQSGHGGRESQNSHYTPWNLIVVT